MPAATRKLRPKRSWWDHAVVRALVISVLLHLVVAGALELGSRLGWWKPSPSKAVAKLFQAPPKALTPLKPLTEEEKKKLEQEKEKEKEPPLLFIETDPTQAVQEPPKDAAYYSATSTRAANADTKQSQPTPKVDGRQEKVPRTIDVQRAKPEQPKPAPQKEIEKEPAKEPEQLNPQQQQPAPRPPQPQPRQPAPRKPQPVEEAPQKPAPKGDLELAKQQPPQPPPSPQPAAETPRKRVRNLAEAKAARGIVEGEKMKQEGGVKRYSLETTFDVRGTPFGAYDAAFIAAVQGRWFALLEERNFIHSQSGKVLLGFKLNKDGRILDMKVLGSDVSEMLSFICQRAVLDPAPFAPFPPDLRRLLNADYREVNFTFHYN